MSEPRSENRPPCTCTSTPVPDEAWTDKGEVPPPIEDRIRFINDDPQCPRHGEGTEYRRKLEERGRELAEMFGLTTHSGSRDGSDV